MSQEINNKLICNVYESYLLGKPIITIADEYNVEESTVRDIIHNYKDLIEERDEYLTSLSEYFQYNYSKELSLHITCSLKTFIFNNYIVSKEELIKLLMSDSKIPDIGWKNRDTIRKFATISKFL